MKKGIIFFVLMASFFTTAITSCKKEEKAAPPITEDLKAHSGRNRAMVEFTAPSGAVSGKVFYGSGKYKEFTITEKAQQVIIEDLPEGESVLRVVTINASGLISNPKAVKAKVYGENYEAALNPRKWKDQVNHSPTSAEIVFENALPTETGVNIIFTNTSGKKDSVKINNTQTTAVLNNIDLEESYYYYSTYKPDTDAIDEFMSGNVDGKEVLMLDFKKQSWKITSFSDQAANSKAEAVIDNNISTSWHSETDLQPAASHWIAVDMGNNKYIDGFYYTNSQSNEKSAESVRFDISSDNITWTKVLETEIKATFLRQKLPLTKTVAARYFKVTVTSSSDADVTSTQFAEIDAYNNVNISSETGKDAWITSTEIALLNADKPFIGDGSNPFPLLGDRRLQRLKDWNHNAKAVVSFDSNGSSFSFFSAAVWGLPSVVNGKVYQTVNLQPGTYQLKIDVASASGPVDIYGVVASSTLLPDYADVTKTGTILRYSNLAENKNTKVDLHFVVPAAMPVTLGFVYNTYNQYSINGTPWTTFKINGLELLKVE